MTEEVPQTRWSWGCFPANRLDGNRMVVPLGCLFSPLGTPGISLQYPPLTCVCKAVLNPYCPVDYRSKTWACVFCNNRNSFPIHYAQMTEQHIPAELMKEHPTVEYVIPVERPMATFALVVDTCLDTEEELEALKEYLLMILEKLPENCNVCLITFGATVQIHELTGATDFPRSLVLRGNSEVTANSLLSLIKNPSHFVCPLNEVGFTLTSIIEELERDLWPVPKEHRPLRCTGAALSAAEALLELAAPKIGSSILAFVSGVCTEGPCQVVGTSREEMIRGHKEYNDTSPTTRFWEQAAGKYDALMRRMVKQGHALNVFSAALDQTGIAEMKTCIQATGGVVLASDSWKKEPLRQSMARFFQRDESGGLAMGLNATIDIVTSPTWKVMGVIGGCIGTGVNSSSVAETEMGQGGTSQWATCSIDKSYTIAAYFEAAHPPQQQLAGGKLYRYVQFITHYQAPGGGDRIRVSTLRHPVMEQTSFAELAKTFDQEASAVLLARLALHKVDSMPLFDVLRWLDRTVIRTVARFGDYVKDSPESLKLPPTFAIFPSFIYHLRRSGYLQVFNASPDETAHLRMLLLKSPCSDSIIMIHPTLHSYTMNAPPQPVALDTSSIQPDNILLFDTFFEVLIHFGETVAAWRAAGYEDNPDYPHFKTFIDGPRADAAQIVAARYPAPRYIECSKGTGDARILHNRINPSRTHRTEGQYGASPGELVYTDDAPLHVFMEQLKKLAVQQ